MKTALISLLLCASLLTSPAYDAPGTEPQITESLSSAADEATPADNSAADSPVPADESREPDESSHDSHSNPDDISGENPEVADISDASSELNDLSAENPIPADESLIDESLSDTSLSDTSLADEALLGAASPTPTPTRAPASALYASDTPVDGATYVIGSVGNSNYCLDINGRSRADDANIHTYKKNGSLSQLFTLKKLGDGSFVFYNYHSDMVITAAGSSAQNRANVSQRPFTGSSLQKWILKQYADGSYSIRCKGNTSLALQIHTGYVKNGQNVRLYTVMNSKAQKFVFENATLPDYSGDIMLRPKYLGYSAVGSDSKSASGTNLRLEIGVADDPFQTFTLSRVWGSFYKISQKASNRVVDLDTANAADGANIHLYSWNGTNAQLWQVQVNADGTYTFRSRCDLDYVLDMEGRGTAMGTNLQLFHANGTASQSFVTTPFTATFPQDVELTISSFVNTDRVFTASTSKFMSYDYSDTAIKKFVLKPVTYSRSNYYWYRIVTTNGKVLGVSSVNSNAPSSGSSGPASAASNSLTITEQSWNGKSCQLWHPQYMTDGTYVIRSALDPSFVIDLKGESEDYRATIQIYRDVGSVAQRWHLSSYTIKSCKISASDHNTVTVKASGAAVRSDNKTAYLFAVEPYEHSLAGKSPLTSTPMSASLTFTAALNKNSSRSLLQKKFYVAVKYCNIYRIVSNAFYITNPEAAATNTQAFPKPARGTKKGLKLSTSDRDIEAGKNLRISYACIDIILDNFLNGSDYAYTYEGRTYRFSSEINYYKQQIKKYNNAGIVVTANVYLLTKRYPDFLQPEARNGSRLWDSSAVAFNTRDEGRKRVEALFACIAEAFTTDGCMVANWVFGNEVNEYICFYYSGGISYNLFHESLAEGYRMFNACVKSRWKNARCYVSFDHNWNVSWPVKDSYMGMNLIKDFNLDLLRQGRVHWDMAMHPYPAPEQDPRFWNRSWTVTNSGDTQQITMLNLSSWAVYLKMTYGTDIHIILNETGLSSTYNGTEMLNEQAAALALTYYIAEFDSNIDTMEYHRNIDDPGETSEGWHLGLYYKPPGGWDYSRPKPSANVFRYMDSASWDSATRGYVSLTGRSSWRAWVPGFDPARFAGKA